MPNYTKQNKNSQDERRADHFTSIRIQTNLGSALNASIKM